MTMTPDSTAATAATTKGKRPFPMTVPLVVVAVMIAIGLLRSWIPYALNEKRQFDWWFDGEPIIVGYLLWLLFVPLLYRIFAYLRAKTWSIPTAVAVWTGVGIGFSALYNVIGSAIFLAPFRIREPETFENILNHYVPAAMAAWVSIFLEFAIIMAAFFAIDFYRRLRTRESEMAEMAKQLSRAQLDALRMQLHPHFLFNAFHSVASLMNEDTAGAQDMLAKLSFLMRRMLEGDEKPQVRLDKEMEYIRGYLDIEQIRFKDRLTVKYEVDPGLNEHLVPNLILQPLVENAIKHGFSRRSDGGWILVSASATEGGMVLAVTDDGGGPQDKGTRAKNGIGLGIGLENVKNRLLNLYGENGTLTVESRANGEFCASLNLPLERDI